MGQSALSEPDSSRRTLAGAVYDDLRREIMSCALRPGDRLRFNQLSEIYGTSASTLRDALFRLVADGLVEVEEQRGFSVAGVSRDRLLDLLQMRLLLEEQGIRLSIAHGGTEWEVGIISSFHRLSRSLPADSDPRIVDAAWERHHADFHRSLLSACRSPLLLQIRETIFSQGERYRLLYKKYATAKRDHADEHRQLMDACLQRAAPRAVELIRAHLTTTVDAVLECSLLEPMSAA